MSKKNMDKKSMDSKEYFEFLKSVLVKIENTLHFLEQEPPKHILAYHKVLGIQQKIGELIDEDRGKLFSQQITIRGVINYFLNGKYKNAYDSIESIKKEIISICQDIQKNEKNKKS